MKPFLKWAGNKYRIVDQIKRKLPQGQRLLEPFLGSAAVFLNTNYPYYYLADANPDLIHFYQYLQQHGQAFIRDCQAFFHAHYNRKEIFYELRNVFNTTQDTYLKSLLFLYLNKHCFNGLCRYNTSGIFNTPFGRSIRPYFPEMELNFFYKKANQVAIVHSDFITTMRQAEKGDVIYCDPPYVPLSATANFTRYSSNTFAQETQIQLAKEAEASTKRGVVVIISNHDNEFTRALYTRAEITELKVQRFISCNGKKRVQASELLAVFT